MFQLIVAVISIALVAALAIASIFYGGDAFTQSSEKAVVATLVNQAQQIAGASQLYKTDHGVAPASVAALGTAGYLSTVPAGAKVTSGAWVFLDSPGVRHVAIEIGSLDTAVSLCDPDTGEAIRQGAECWDLGSGESMGPDTDIHSGAVTPALAFRS